MEVSQVQVEGVSSQVQVEEYKQVQVEEYRQEEVVYGKSVVEVVEML